MSELDLWEPWEDCWKEDPYDGPRKVYPVRHGVDCPGHRDWNILGWTRDPDSNPLPDPTKWWGKLYSEEIVEVDPRYL